MWFKIPGSWINPTMVKEFLFFTLFFYTLHGLHFLTEKKIKWFPLRTTQKFTVQILFFDFSIKAQALLQTINLKSLQAKSQLKKSVVLQCNITPLQLHHYNLLIAAHLRSPIHFHTTKYILPCVI